MYYIDLRHSLLLAINILKSQLATTLAWDPFHTIDHPSGMKNLTFTILFLVFPFTCIQVPLTCSLDTAHIIVRLGKFDPCLTVSLLASIVFPQAIFWYAYPIIIMISLLSSWLLNVLWRFLSWLRKLLTSIPVFDIIIRATVTRWQNLESQHEVEEIELHQQSQEPSSDGGTLDAVIEVNVL